MGYNAVQKQVLEALLDQYERSKTYQGENKVIQSFQIPPEKVFPDYASDYADMDQIRDFEAWMREWRDQKADGRSGELGSVL